MMKFKKYLVKIQNIKNKTKIMMPKRELAILLSKNLLVKAGYMDKN